MTFLNFILLGGVAALGIPLIIHLLNKRRFQVIEWGAVHLLEEVIRKNHQRLRLEQLLLLLIRILIPVLLALCLARPVITGIRQFLGDEKTSTVILLDNSYSMRAGGAEGSLLSRAQSELANLVEALPVGSDLNVVLMGGRPGPLLDDPTTALDTVPEQLREEVLPSNPIRVEEALRAGLGQFEHMNHAARELVVLSDFRKADWGDQGAAARAALAAEISDRNIAPQVTLFQLQADSTENIAIASIDVSALILGRGQKFSLRANVRNHGKAAYPDLEVWFDADGKRARSSRINLPPGGEGQVLFTHQFDRAGDHAVTIGTSGDVLEEDNLCHAVIPVWDSVNTMLANGDPASLPLEGETDFLEIALQPFTSAKASLNDLIVSEVVDPRRLDIEKRENTRVVVLANVEQLDGGRTGRLRNWVEDGGALLVFCGDRVRLDWSERELYRKGSGLLPARLAGFGNAGSPGPRGGAPRVARILATRFSHPALAFFNDPRNGRLNDAEFTNWYRLELPPESEGEERPGANVLARFDNGDPFLVERPYGKGRVIQCAAPADADWSDLPTHTCYLPLMQRLVTYLASSVAPPRDLTVGEPLRALVPPDVPAETGMLVIDPSGEEHLLPIREEDGRRSVAFPDTRLPGIYKLIPADRAPDAPLAPQFFAANYDRREADLEPLSEEAVQSLAAEFNAQVVRSGAEYAALDQLRRFGQEMWKPLLIALLVFLFAEILLQQWMSRRTL